MINKIQKLLSDIQYREQNKILPDDEAQRLAYHLGRKELIDELILKVEQIIKEEQEKSNDTVFRKLKKRFISHGTK
jgi:hypothetical protein